MVVNASCTVNQAIDDKQPFNECNYYVFDGENLGLYLNKSSSYRAIDEAHGVHRYSFSRDNLGVSEGGYHVVVENASEKFDNAARAHLTVSEKFAPRASLPSGEWLFRSRFFLKVESGMTDSGSATTQ